MHIPETDSRFNAFNQHRDICWNLSMTFHFIYNICSIFLQLQKIHKNKETRLSSNLFIIGCKHFKFILHPVCKIVQARDNLFLLYSSPSQRKFSPKPRPITSREPLVSCRNILTQFSNNMTTLISEGSSNSSKHRMRTFVAPLPLPLFLQKQHPIVNLETTAGVDSDTESKNVIQTQIGTHVDEK